MKRLPRRSAVFVLWGAVATAAVLFVVWLALPWPQNLATENPTTTSFMRYREAEARAKGRRLEIHQEWVPLARIPRDLVRSVLVSEDDRFREHHGVDWKALATGVHWTGGETFSWSRPGDWIALVRAGGYAWRHRHEIKGRSTITQQLAKNLYFTPKRSFVRKAEELVVARRLEHYLTKDRILELYLNTVELGHGLFGVGAAARRYFGVPVQDLDAFQAASLAATLPQPLTSNPGYRPGRMAWRRDLILERLAGRDVVIPSEPPSLSLPAPLADSSLSGGAGGTDPPPIDASSADTVGADTFRADTPAVDTLAARVDTTLTP